MDILTAKDIPGNNGFGIYPDVKDQPALADKTVRYRGEPILALVGEHDAIYAIDDNDLPILWFKEEPLQGLDKPLAEGADLIHPSKPGNILAEGCVMKGDALASLASSPIIAEGNFKTGFVEHAISSRRQGWAQRVGDRIEICTSTQSPYMDRDEVAQLLGIEKERCTHNTLGLWGGFGGKLDLSVQTFLSIAAWKHKLPVRMVYDRKESMTATTKRHPSRITARYGCDENGSLTSFLFDGDFNTGAYTSWGLTVKDRVPIHASGPYYVPAIRAKISGNLL